MLLQSMITEKKLSKTSQRVRMRRASKYKSNQRKESFTKVFIFEKNLPFQKHRIITINQIHVTRIENLCKVRFGFEPYEKLKLWQNVRKLIGNMKLVECHPYNSNMRCDDLCTKKSS